MYLSRIRLSSADLQIARIATDYEIHQFVYSLFPEMKKRDFLYRAEYGASGGLSLIIQSVLMPAAPDYGSIEIRKIPVSFYEYDEYVFSLRINSVKRTGSKVSKIITDDNEIIEWLCGLMAIRGMDVFHNSIQIVQKDVMLMKKGKNSITLAYCDVIGVMKISDRKLFEKTVIDGIGRSKGFGLGLLLVKPVKEDN